MSEGKITSNNTKPTSRVGITAAALACLALIIAFGALFLTIQNWLEQNKLQLLSTYIPQLIKNQTQEDIQSALEKVTAQINSQQQAIQALQQTLAQSNDSIQPTYAKELINLAQLSQQTGSQLQVTSTLLQQAKQKLNPHKENALISAIDKDLTYLQNGTQTNQSLAKLNSAKSLVAELQPQSSPAQNSSAQKQIQHWYQRWWQNFHGLFVIQHFHHINEQLLTPDQTVLIKAALSLQLDTANWALLQNNVTLFKQSLMQAAQLANAGFKPTQPLEELNLILSQLTSTQIQPQHQLLSYQLINH